MSHSLKRARTQDQKHFRRQQILEAAEQHFHDVGYEAFSMASLAKLAGVVKGTLYLYFKTREEVFLTLYNRSLSRYSETFLGSCQHDMTDRLCPHHHSHGRRSFRPATHATGACD